MNPSLFIHQSSSSSFNHHHQTKNHHKQTCNRATLRSVSVNKSCWNEKRQILRRRGKKRRNPAVQFRGSISRDPNSATRREIPRPAATVGPDEQQIDSFFVKQRYVDR